MPRNAQTCHNRDMQEVQAFPVRPYFFDVANCPPWKACSSKHTTDCPRSAVFYTVAARRLTMLFLLPRQAKGLLLVCHKSLCPSIKERLDMHHPFREEELFDLQRMPATRRTSHTPARQDTTVHTPDTPFCYDPLCSCRQKEIQRVLLWLEQGLLTEHEAVAYFAGRTL